MKSENELEVALRRWSEGSASLGEIRSLAMDIGSGQYRNGIPALVDLLEHEDAIVRLNAADSLAFDFHFEPVAERFVAMLTMDQDSDCRGMAAAAMGSLKRGSDEAGYLAALGRAALFDPDKYVRRSAYCSLLVVHGISDEQYTDLICDGSTFVSTERVREILGESGRGSG